MKRKIVVCLVIFGMFFSGVNIDFVNVKAEEKVLTITNKGSSYDYPTSAIAGQPYTFTVRWTQNFDADLLTQIVFIDKDHKDPEKLYPWELLERFEPGFSTGSHSYTFTVTTPNDGRTSWNVRLNICGCWQDATLCPGDNYYYTINVSPPPSPLNVNLWIDKGCGATYNIGDPIKIYFEVNKACYITLKVTTSQGTKTNISNEYVSTGTHYITGTVGEPTGEHKLTIYAEDSYGNTAHDTCSFYAEKQDPCEGMNCDQYDGYVGEKYCKNGDVYRKYRDYYCENGECKYREEERKIEDCKEGCENGGCIVDPCKNKNCDQYDGYVGEKYCKNGDVYRKYRDYYCENGECKYWEEERKIRDCDYGCENGGCIVKDPCEGVSCPDQCRGYDLWAYECDNGNCVPTYVIEKNCPECGYDPCEHDSDNDGVPDCEDECEDTPSSRFVDNKGCPVCLSKEDRCAFQAGALVPLIGGQFDAMVVIDNLCRLNVALESGDSRKILRCVMSLVGNAAMFVAGLIMDIATGTLAGIPASVAWTAVEGALTIKECGFDLADSYGADESFYSGVHDEMSKKFAEENMDVMNVYVGSPAELVIKDSKGNVLNKNNTTGIPGGIFFSHDHYKFAFIVNPEEKYRVETIGTGKGTYDLKIASVKHGSIKEKNYEDVEISRGEVDTYEVEVTSQGEIEVEEERDTPLWIFIVVIILLASIVGVYVSRGKLEGIKISRNFDQKMIKKLKKQLEKGEITMEEYNQKIKDLGLSQKVKTGKKAPKHFDKNLAERLDELLERGKITREEYLQKKEDIGLTPEFDLLKRLDERFKKGEISKDEYLQKKRDLEA